MKLLSLKEDAEMLRSMGPILVLLLLPSFARADISLLVSEAIGLAGEYTASGHTAVYLSDVCADGFDRLRMCRPDETGVVLSSYPELIPGRKYEWIAVPMNSFLYGVEDIDKVPLYANGEIRNFVRETYRAQFLGSLVPPTQNGAVAPGDWPTMLAQTYNRDVYSFTVSTTRAEDLQFISRFNARENVSKFNVFSDNCADFARRTLNMYFPGAVSRDWINDFGITTPKAVARTFTDHVKRRPERLFYVRRYPQIAGPIWRSYDNRNFTEMAFKSKKYLIPSILFQPELIVIFAGAYFLTGEFDVQRTHEKIPTPRIAELRREKRNIQRGLIIPGIGRKERIKEIDHEVKRLEAIEVGNEDLWKAHKTEFASVLRNAIQRRLFQDEKEVRSFFRDLELQSEPDLDQNGMLMLKVEHYGSVRMLGLTRQNILAPFSDPELALKLLLAKINYDVNAKTKDRSLYPEFAKNWVTMRYLTQMEPSIYASIDVSRGRFLVNKPPSDLGRQMKKFVITLTH